MQEKSKIFLIWVKGKDLKNFKGSKGLKDNKGRKGRRKGRNKRAQENETGIQCRGNRQSDALTGTCKRAQESETRIPCGIIDERRNALTEVGNCQESMAGINAGLSFQFGVEGGDDEAAESGVELAGGRVTVVLAVGGVTMFPFRFLCGIFEDG